MERRDFLKNARIVGVVSISDLALAPLTWVHQRSKLKTTGIPLLKTGIARHGMGLGICGYDMTGRHSQ